MDLGWGQSRVESLGRGDERICIAVLDGPVDVTHPCFQGAKLTTLATLASPSVGGGAASEHGTHVASVLFGQPGSLIQGIAPYCRGLIIPIFTDDRENLACSQLDLARAILLAIDNGAHVINISGGQLTPTVEPEPVLAHAIETCARRNTLIVAAAGNDGCECIHVPAAAKSVLAVGAMDSQGAPLISSNWGRDYREQGILAPGAAVLGASPGGGTARKTGTSFATPFVSGVVALLACTQIAHGKPPDVHAIRQAILTTAIACNPSGGDDCRRFLSGVINVAGAVEALTGGDEVVTENIKLSHAASDAPGNDCADTELPDSPELGVDSLLDVSSERQRGGSVQASAGVRLKDKTASIRIATEPTPRVASQVTASDCSCGGGSNCDCGCSGADVQKPALVYALGMLGYDFGTEARRDSFIQAMPQAANNPLNPEQLLSHLEAHPYDAPSVIWTLNLDSTPIYAIQPAGPYSTSGYERLREFLAGQVRDGVELVSIPGVIGGKVRLQSGQVVPVVVPVLRGMYSWATTPLVQNVLGARPQAAKAAAAWDTHSTGLRDFLNRVYYDLRNLGITSEERALNYAATNAVQVAGIIRATTQEEFDLDRVAVKRSPVCRPDSDCYDIEISFFNPSNTNVANRIFRFTVDVSDVVPVTIGTVRSWTKRG